MSQWFSTIRLIVTSHQPQVPRRRSPTFWLLHPRLMSFPTFPRVLPWHCPQRDLCIYQWMFHYLFVWIHEYFESYHISIIYGYHFRKIFNISSVVEEENPYIFHIGKRASYTTVTKQYNLRLLTKFFTCIIPLFSLIKTHFK